MFEISPTRMEQEVLRCIKANVVPYFRSSPGVGKSSVVAKVAKENKLILIDLRLSQCTPEDLQGFPMRNGDKATFTPFDMFPLKGDQIPEGYNGWLILLDELSSAGKPVQAAAYKLILDRMVGSFQLHEKVAMVAAGNLDTDKAVVFNMSTALQSRLIHYELKPVLSDWMNWAVTQNFDHRILAFLNFKKNMLMNFDPNHSDKTFPCPRTWEFLNRLIKDQLVNEDTLPCIAGTIGQGAATEFNTFCKVYKQLPSVSQITSDPINAPIPEEPGAKYAVASMLTQELDANNIKDIIIYIERFDIEMKIIFARGAFALNRKLRDESPEFYKFASDMLKYLK